MLCQLLQQFAPGRLTQAMPLISQPTRPVCVRVKWLSMHSTSHETTAASGLPGIALSRKCVRRMSAVISRHGVESPVRHPSANSELYTGLFGNLRRLPTPQARRECAASTKDLNVPLADTVPDTVLIVESKTKANKIQKYLGPAFKVIESQGHIRDLAAKGGSVDPATNFHMTWNVDTASQKRVDNIQKALQQDGITRLVLATDPDREGEAIAWHLTDIMQDALHGKQVQRITFTEVTQKAVEAALAHPREIDGHLVNAYKARRALDYLMGYGMSPILWSKLGGARSAGRVQSPALRLLTEQEQKITLFRPEEWWSVEVTLTGSKGMPFKAEVISVDGKRGSKFDLKTQAEADALGRRIAQASLQVTAIKRQDYTRSPEAPYMTSTMLMDAANQLGSNVGSTIAAAQGLFEGDIKDSQADQDGLITYIRTDSPSLDDDAAEGICHAVRAIWGLEHLANSPKLYKQKGKLAQEGHGGITPTDPMLIPAAFFKLVKGAKGAHPPPASLSTAQRKLYELIWRRTLASQMADAQLRKVTVEFGSADGSLQLRAGASQVVSPGFLIALDNFDIGKQGQPDEAEGDELQSPPARIADKDTLAGLLTNLKEGQEVEVEGVPPKQHFTKAPPRYSEAMLVKTLQEKGIGRPSTYGAIITALQARGYVVREGRGLRPTSMGKLVVAFLQNHFTKYLDYDYTSDMESQLDEIAGGRAGHLELLQDFWPEFDTWIQAAGSVSVREVVDQLDSAMAPILFPLKEGQTEEDARACPACTKRSQQGQLGLKPARGTGGFIGCSNYPSCTYSQPMENTTPSDEALEDTHPGLSDGPVLLGQHPTTAEDVVLRTGKYGPYLQLGTDKSVSAVHSTTRVSRPKRSKTAASSTAKAKTVSLSKEELASLSLESALELLKWPVLVGQDSNGLQVHVAKGRTGFYLQQGALNATLPKDLNPHATNLEAALNILAAKLKASQDRPHRNDKKQLHWTASDQKSSNSSTRSKVTRSSSRSKAGSSKNRNDKSPDLSTSHPSDIDTGQGQTRGHIAAGKADASKAGKAKATRAAGSASKAGNSGTQASSKGRTKGNKQSSSRSNTKEPAADTPKTGYRLFWRQQWNQLKVDNPGIQMTDANKQIALLWRSMDANAKDQYK